jgi:ATP-dependent Clp protease adapter protein ClpS
MTCDLAVEDLPLPDLEAVYRIAAARVTHAVRQGRVEAALRWGRILNLALRDRELRARLPVTPDEVRRRMGEAQPVEEPRERIEAPTPSHPLHCLRVLLLNDDYTPMEFVVHVLERFFNKDRAEATQIMMHVHQNGVGECGVFTYEVAETKVTLVMDLARKHMHPLQCVMEKK